MEHRWGNRIAVNLPVRISSAGVTGSGTLRDLSVSGAFIETTLPLATMTMVRIRILRGPERSSAAQAQAFVVRREANGFGVELCELAGLAVTDVAASGWHSDSPQSNTVHPQRLTIS